VDVGGPCQRSAGGAIDASATRAVEFERNSEELDFVHEAIAAALADHQVEVMFGLIGDANLFMANAFVEQYGGRYVSRRRCRARRANMPEYGRCRPSGGYQPELPPRTLPKHALRSPPPTPQRSAGLRRSASAANSQHDFLTPIDSLRAERCSPRRVLINGARRRGGIDRGCLVAE